MINNLNFMLLLTQLRVLSHASQFCIFKKCQPLRCHGMTLIHAWIVNHTSVKSGGGGGGGGGGFIINSQTSTFQIWQ